MHYKDISLLGALDVLLNEGSVVGAAEKLHLSSSAVSRILARIRAVTGDDILVPAGRTMVLTAHAESLRDEVRECVRTAQSLLERKQALDVSTLSRTFTVRANDSIITAFGPRLFAHISARAPKVVLRLVQQKDQSVTDLRTGEIDLDVGVVSETGPEVMIQTLFKDHFVAVVREGHPLATNSVDLSAFTHYQQISASRRGRLHGPLDHALHQTGYRREVVAVVPTFVDALCFARQSDLVAIVPDLATRHLRDGLCTFDLPVLTESIVFSQAWHPRFHRDVAHQWLRDCVRSICTLDA